MKLSDKLNRFVREHGPKIATSLTQTLKAYVTQAVEYESILERRENKIRELIDMLQQKPSVANDNSVTVQKAVAELEEELGRMDIQLHEYRLRAEFAEKRMSVLQSENERLKLKLTEPKFVTDVSTEKMRMGYAKVR